ncbi:Zn-ribbon domain-containing OB-fold protein [Natronobeatus ordinarius]|uniref:Zn-ribbon domain-containing OB-fold protein n=1 Tax=Natronobeatus ordinarius TaxID=2963433 RepID=UPI0020CF516A|nr:Zn-ribbon domain-containing OB-fold protein [Natronobeatus ordinarius]
MSDARDAGYDDWLEAVEEGEPYYLECPEGHGSLPPRRVCPDCGATDLEETPLPAAGEIATFTITHVPTPSFADDAPYVVGVADFGPVRITGQVVGVDPTAVETGTAVELEVATSETTGDRVLALRPR